MQIDRALLKASWQSWISNDLRPRAGPYWMQWLWTLLFSAALAVLFTLLGFVAYGRGEGAWRNLNGWAYWYGKNFIVCLVIGATIHLLFELGSATVAKPHRVARWPMILRTIYFSGVPLLGVVLAWPLGLWLAGQNVIVWFGSSDGRNVIFGTVMLSLVITFLLHHWFASKAAEADADRRATEAQLRLLQAQIEPHFLFNTLANVISLIDHDAPKARQMLESFTDYLRSSLTSLRHDESTLGSELDLVNNYLALLKSRMEDRLHYSITKDPALSDFRLPPLLLQPLVENSVVHGLEPSIEGGCVQVSAHLQGRQLVLEVRDDGRGLDAPPRAAGRASTRGHGLALANIRQRLLTRYGSTATLEVLPAQPGTLARITLPLPETPP